MNWRRLAVCAPLAAGVAISALAAGGRLANPVIYVRADVAAWAVLLGGALTLLATAWLLLHTRQRAARSQSAASAQRAAAEERRRFLERLDHELKNPITAIRAALANLDTQAGPRPDTVASISAQAVRLSRLTADLRKLADLETQTLERAPVNVGELLREAVAIAQEQPSASGRRLRLTVPQAPWPLPHVLGDGDLLFLAIHNLLDNALKFSAEGDTIEVRGFEDGASVVIEVADTGPGIPPADLDHVWDELYRSPAARGVPGSGLGLPLVRAIAQRHGGGASVRSRPEQGTVVSLRLPVTEP